MHAAHVSAGRGRAAHRALPVAYRARAVCALLFGAGVLADFASVRLYRSFEVADLCVIAAGTVALQSAGRARVWQLWAAVRGDWRLIAVGGAGVAFLVGSGIATAAAGLPASGVDTWLLFALLILLVAPLSAAAIALEPGGMLWLLRGIVAGAAVGAGGLLGQVAAGTPLYGARLSGVLGSDPLYLILAAAAIVCTHLASQLRGGWRDTLRDPEAWVELLLLALFASALVVSRSRSAWIGLLVLAACTAYVATRRVRWSVGVLVGVGGGVALAYLLHVLPEFAMRRIELTLAWNSPDIAARNEVVSRLLDVWTGKPWGLGLSQSADYLPERFVAGKTGAGHNVVLSALVEGGPLAALGMMLLPFAVAAAWVRSARHLWSVPWHHLWCLPALATLFVAAQATPSFYFHAGWLSVGAALGSAIRMRASPAIKLRRGPGLLPKVAPRSAN